MKFKENCLYKIEIKGNYKGWFAFGKDMEIVYDILKVKKPFTEEFHWNESERHLNSIEPLKGNRAYSNHNYSERIFSNFEIVEMGVPVGPDSRWIDRSWDDVMKLKVEAKANYLKLSWWEKFKIACR